MVARGTLLLLLLYSVYPFVPPPTSQNSELAKLSRIYDQRNVAELEQTLARLREHPSPSHILPIITSLKHHIDVMQRTKIPAEDLRNNPAALMGLYGRTLRLLDDSIEFYFGRYGADERKVSSHMLFLILKDFLATPQGPFFKRGFSEYFTAKSYTLYLALPKMPHSAIPLHQLQDTLPFRVSPFKEQDVNQLLESQPVIPILKLEQVKRYGAYYLASYFLDFRGKRAGPGPPDDPRARGLYEHLGKEFKSIDYWVPAQ